MATNLTPEMRTKMALQIQALGETAAEEGAICDALRDHADEHDRRRLNAQVDARQLDKLLEETP